MALDPKEDARRELVELRKLIDDCRQDLGIGEGSGSSNGARRSGGLLRRRVRGSRRARRQAPVT
jgi:hypothetical protein